MNTQQNREHKVVNLIGAMMNLCVDYYQYNVAQRKTIIWIIKRETYQIEQAS